ncbi:hypothetical protein KAT36_01635 [Candidatus Pacearchaeota archaeon]|nr:hypothetical protein [Candidatus Pacearchaeota archaeon]
MKKMIVVGIVIMMFGMAEIVFAGGITGGTTRNTTNRQRQQAQQRMDNQQCKDPGVSQETLNMGKKILNKVYPVTETMERLIRGMKWAADKQRDGGGVPPTGSTVKGNPELVGIKSSNFYNETKRYVESGALFRAMWNNLNKVIGVKDICPGGFLVAVDFNRGGRQYYEIRSFEFPLPEEVISKIEEVNNTYWNVRTIRDNNLQSLGFITVNQLRKHGRRGRDFRTGALYKWDLWKFSYKRNSGYWFLAIDIASKIYIPSADFQEKFLREETIEFLKDTQRFSGSEHKAIMYKKIPDTWKK